MWAVENQTKFAADGAWGRDKDGVHEWIVAVRGTFDVSPDGTASVADEQRPPLLLPEYNGADGESSLRYDADLVAAKPATDVVVNGTAYAPAGEPAREFHVSFAVGDVGKQIKVIGDRRWESGLLGLRRSAPEPVTRVPVLYERCYGGSDLSNPDPKKQRLDLRNPVGCGLVAAEGLPLPNFEYPRGRVDQTGPAGFGAIASFWSPRRERCGTYDDRWHRARYPLLPEDWDPRSLLCSPEDQRTGGHLEGGEMVELVNLTANGFMRFALPRRSIIFRTTFSGLSGPRAEEYRGRLETVILEPDHPRVILVWTGVLTCRSDPDYLEETVVMEASH